MKDKWTGDLRIKVDKGEFDSALSKLLASPATPKKTISPKKKTKTARPKTQIGPKGR